MLILKHYTIKIAFSTLIYLFTTILKAIGGIICLSVTTNVQEEDCTEHYSKHPNSSSPPWQPEWLGQVEIMGDSEECNDAENLAQ